MVVLKRATCFVHCAKLVDLQMWKDKIFGNLSEISTFKLVGFLAECRKKKQISLHDFGENLRRKIRTLIVREIVREC